MKKKSLLLFCFLHSFLVQPLFASQNNKPYFVDADGTIFIKKKDTSLRALGIFLASPMLGLFGPSLYMAYQSYSDSKFISLTWGTIAALQVSFGGWILYKSIRDFFVKADSIKVIIGKSAFCYNGHFLIPWNEIKEIHSVVEVVEAYENEHLIITCLDESVYKVNVNELALSVEKIIELLKAFCERESIPVKINEPV